MTVMTKEQAERLINRVNKLSDRFRTGRRVIIGLLLVVAVLIGVIIRGGVLIDEQDKTADKLSDTVEDLEATQVELKATVKAIEATQRTICENGNESRKVHHDFWSYIVAVSVQSNPDAPPAVTEFYTDLQATIDQAFGQRDCDDLTKTYPAPRFPRIPTPDEIEGG
jgi:outer membrane murein-binding lipoprotein Lpp